jgi:hypothetical protein
MPELVTHAVSWDFLAHVMTIRLVGALGLLVCSETAVLAKVLALRHEVAMLGRQVNGRPGGPGRPEPAWPGYTRSRPSPPTGHPGYAARSVTSRAVPDLPAATRAAFAEAPAAHRLTRSSSYDTRAVSPFPACVAA